MTYAMILSGLPGAGKTTLARAINRVDGSARVLSNDEIRESLGYPRIGSTYTRLVYKELAQRASAALRAGCSVILDATFYCAAYREIVVPGLAGRDVSCAVIMVVTPVPVCRRRVEERLAIGASRGVDDVARFDALVAKWEEWSIEEWPVESMQLCVDSSKHMPLIRRVSGIERGAVLDLVRAVCREE